MLTESRKRQHSSSDESGHLVPQAKRQNRAHPLSPEPGRDAWDSESSNSSSSLSSPEHASGSRCVAGPCSPLGSVVPGDPPASYLHINRILREAHFQSLHNRCQVQETQE
ncbi:protein FAM104A [Corythoichthys intestinalis]|uniref:protein FAM104A n=1 Tax=Corythoichthys intestinalis TaxID=161448 RepID=UPI0025A56F39|nr:protein FAM104A [Corythoichthys intestinalis]XP_061805747.1 protein FAM104A-like [Nerophis lumbriciformis]